MSCTHSHRKARLSRGSIKSCTPKRPAVRYGEASARKIHDDDKRRCPAQWPRSVHGGQENYEAALAARGFHSNPAQLRVAGRVIRARRRAGNTVWFSFKELCGGPRSQDDYLELAARFHTVLLSDVPQMSAELASEARRFTWLVDVFYDRRVKLIVSAAVPPEQLYTNGPLVNKFPRTVSRLREMQSADYLAAPRRTVDTRLA